MQYVTIFLESLKLLTLEFLNDEGGGGRRGKQGGNSAIIVKVGIQFSFYIFIPYEVSIQAFKNEMRMIQAAQRSSCKEEALCVIFMILVSLENVTKYFHVVARLPQRLKSTLFETPGTLRPSGTLCSKKFQTTLILAFESNSAFVPQK